MWIVGFEMHQLCFSECGNKNGIRLLRKAQDCQAGRGLYGSIIHTSYCLYILYFQIRPFSFYIFTLFRWFYLKGLEPFPLSALDFLEAALYLNIILFQKILKCKILHINANSLCFHSPTNKMPSLFRLDKLQSKKTIFASLQFAPRCFFQIYCSLFSIYIALCFPYILLSVLKNNSWTANALCCLPDLSFEISFAFSTFSKCSRSLIRAVFFRSCLNIQNFCF